MASARPRTPGGVFAGVTIVLVLLLLGVALTTRQPPPPTIAEFAPQAIENIAESPEDQAGRRGAGAEHEAAVETPTPQPAVGDVIEVPRVRKCVGDPPRQIEDPQSPPCVPYWTGDNGGATYKGVTRDEIRITVANYDLNGGEPAGLDEAFAAFFNKRFELYGRKLKIFGGDAGGIDAESARAAAAERDERDHVFASEGGNHHFQAELARRHLMSINLLSTATSEPDMQALHPYVWMYQMSLDRQMAMQGEWACARLAGRNASHSGTPERPRKFGAVLQHMYADDTMTLAGLERTLARCGVTLAEKIEFTDTDDPTPAGQNHTSASFATNAAIQLRTAGVTSVFCYCVHTTFTIMARVASEQNYFPEWLFASYYFLDYDGVQTAAPPKEQIARAFGTSVNPKQLTLDRVPAVWAVREVNPSYQFLDNSFSMSGVLGHYRALLMVASAVQMAGPRLTPETFAQGLQRTRFPNPATDLYAGAVGFTGDHSMTDDAAEIWWSNTARTPYSGDTGGYCYVDRGARRAHGWPAGDPFFSGTCDSGV